MIYQPLSSIVFLFKVAALTFFGVWFGISLFDVTLKVASLKNINGLKKRRLNTKIVSHHKAFQIFNLIRFSWPIATSQHFFLKYYFNEQVKVVRQPWLFYRSRLDCFESVKKCWKTPNVLVTMKMRYGKKSKCMARHVYLSYPKVWYQWMYSTLKYNLILITNKKNASFCHFRSKKSNFFITN